MAKAPVDVSPFYKLITGSIVSEAPSDPTRLGVESELFPVLKWESWIKSVRFEEDELRFEPGGEHHHPARSRAEVRGP